ncbi:hypothetical protein Tco_1230876 [Tanacetum coccineum]
MYHFQNHKFLLSSLFSILLLLIFLPLASNGEIGTSGHGPPFLATGYDSVSPSSNEGYRSTASSTTHDSINIEFEEFVIH